MKLRILKFGINATHDLISDLRNFDAEQSISDFDAFIYDPGSFHSATLDQISMVRRQMEIRDLILKKGGIVICILRPDNPVSGGYLLLDATDPGVIALIRGYARLGAGSQMRLLSSARGCLTAYFQVLKGTLSFEAFLQCSEAQLNHYAGTIFAVDSVEHPVAVEFEIGEGRICFAPLPKEIEPARLGAAIVKVIKAHFDRTTEIDAPDWTSQVTVPQANVHDHQITELTRRKDEFEAQIDALKFEREKLLKYVWLLFGYGKAVLEPVVRSAFRLFGFVVPEPEEYEGEWDVELRQTESARTALGEVEGSEGVIDVDKYRQLLDYIDAETLEGRDHKGILIGNGFRLLAPEAPERQSQFSDHAQRGAARNDFCLVPTTELFKAVCAVLESPQDDSLKRVIRESLLTTVGVWRFVRQETPQGG
jgi:hypothetical protein